MKKRVVFAVSAALLLGTVAPASAQDKVVIKFGTRAPANSAWHLSLKEAAEKWREVSGGKVELKIFPGGTMGDEGDLIKKMNVGQLQAVGVSTVGLHVIAHDPQAIDVPMMVSSREEYRCALSKMAPKFEKVLESKGFVVLAWGEIGFTRFFSTEARPTLAAMRTSKMFSWEGDPDSITAWKNAGFKPVVLSSADMVPSLQVGKIDAVCYPPVLILAAGMHNKAKYMLDLPYSSLTGATVVSKSTWDKVPEALRPKLIEIFHTYSAKIDQDVVRMEKDSLEKMKQQGLQVVPVQDLPEWRKAMDALYNDIRGKVVPAQTLDEVQQAIKECRAAKK
ncbi:MAG TPA: TRAP transporter substrate-binding protein DctP [Pseudomonadota bacterium]|nr:TRAP transporter substrate-binding protein DctP [Pseudomonadota bacterium]